MERSLFLCRRSRWSTTMKASTRRRGDAHGIRAEREVGAVGDAAARPLWEVHPVRLSLKATCHHVYRCSLGPPMTVPWFPCASTPIEGVPDDGVDGGVERAVVATVMPIASVGAAVTVTVTD